MSDDKKTALAKINPHLPAPSPDKKSAQPRETPPVPETDAAPRDLAAVPAPDFSIVGIGASAGGLTAFESFFAGIPDDGKPGMAFVLIQHLAPNHKSMLAELISRSTKMHVFEVEDGMTIRNNCVYIIPPDRTMILEGGKLRLLKPSEPRGMRLPIDTFFKSMAQELREKALCIILSGTGSDGSNGIRAVKKQGGQVLVQNPDNITFDGMPRSALATGLADFVLAPEEMPAILMTPSRLPRHAPERPTISAEMIRESCELLHGQTGHDFSQYKKNTLIRRVERRMALHSMDRAEDYLHHLHNSPGEVQNLFRDLLIGVTSFFRDPEAFDVLQKQVIPHLFTGKPLNVPVRLWVCGCATGEEAYSMAILLREYTESIKKNFTIQIFATDIDPEGIRQARTGFYPADIAEAITPERLRRFFSKEGDGRYRVKKNIRDMLIFSEQNVTKDPPFSRIDLISCRNLLIYLSATLQKKTHYSVSLRTEPQRIFISRQLGNGQHPRSVVLA